MQELACLTTYFDAQRDLSEHHLPSVSLLEWGCSIGVKLLDPGHCLPGEVGHWKFDLDLWCRLCPLLHGGAPVSGDSSLVLFTSSSCEALWHLWVERPSLWPCVDVLAMACISSRCLSWTSFRALDMALSCSLARASSQIFSLSEDIIKVVSACCAISVSVLSPAVSHGPSVSVMLLSQNSDPASRPVCR